MMVVTFNFFMFNNGFHGAHHMKPGLHWSLIPAYYNKNLKPYINPSLDRESLFVYLWQAHVYPGKRIDYLGNQVVLKPLSPDLDWVQDVKVKENEEELVGA